MQQTKCDLILRYGTRCMLCGEDVGLTIQWHHIRPRYSFKRCGEEIDNSIHNGALLCPNCHTKIHKYQYGDKEYTRLTNKIAENKR
jgi:predicted HNH restriction endonuclease